LFIDWYYSLFDVLYNRTSHVGVHSVHCSVFKGHRCHRLIATTCISYQTFPILSTHFPQKTKNNFHSSANTGVGNKISVVSHPIQENPYNVYYNINRPVEPPHQLQPKPFHNHHGNSPARSSFPSRAVFARHNASSKKIRKV